VIKPLIDVAGAATERPCCRDRRRTGHRPP
jgi:hypothetical protein